MMSKEPKQKQMDTPVDSTCDQNTGLFSKRKIKETFSAIGPKQGYLGTVCQKKDKKEVLIQQTMCSIVQLRKYHAVSKHLKEYAQAAMPLHCAAAKPKFLNVYLFRFQILWPVLTICLRRTCNICNVFFCFLPSPL